MNRLLRRLTTAAAAAAVAAPVVLATAPAQAASLCSTDCITSATATATTQTIRTSVRTTGYVHATAEIWNAAGTSRVSYTNVAADTPYWYNAFTFTSTGTLAQNTWYSVKVVAKDMLGKTRTKWVPVRVKYRTATYSITRINLADDSDTVGAGEFTGGWKAVSTVRNALWSGVSSKSSGGSWTFAAGDPRATIVRTKEIAKPKVFLELLDDDDEGIGMSTCGTSTLPTFTNGSNDCADWATAGAALVLPEYSATVPFTLYVAKTASVKFTVTGKVVQTVA